MFSIVQFEEGLDVVPTIWLNKDKMISKWPPFSMRESYKIVKAKKNYQSQQSNGMNIAFLRSSKQQVSQKIYYLLITIVAILKCLFEKC